MRVAFHDKVKGFVYSMKPGDKEFLDVFYTKLKENTSRTRGGSRAEDFRKKHKIEWSYHDWPSGDVRVSVPPEK